MRGWLTWALVLGVPLLAPGAASAWHRDGHMAIARLGWKQLDDKQRLLCAAILKAHPHYDLFLAGGNRPEEISEPEWVFMRAATWPDWVRAPQAPDLTPKERRAIVNDFHKGKWHYINLPYIHPADAGKFDAEQVRKDVLEPPLDANREPRHVLAALKQAMDVLTSADTRPKERAVQLCWLLHLVGDVHQPLHAVGLIADKGTIGADGFSPRDGGDRGGNLVAIKKPGDPQAVVLHFYWDALLFEEEAPPARIDRVVDALLDEFPRPKLPELAAGTFLAWADEGLALARTVAYRGDGGFLKVAAIPPQAKITRDGHVLGLDAPALPDGYPRAAENVARRRMALAGYRLADQLRLVFAAGQ